MLSHLGTPGIPGIAWSILTSCIPYWDHSAKGQWPFARSAKMVKSTRRRPETRTKGTENHAENWWYNTYPGIHVSSCTYPWYLSITSYRIWLYHFYCWLFLYSPRYRLGPAIAAFRTARSSDSRAMRPSCTSCCTRKRFAAPHRLRSVNLGWQA